MGTERKIKAIGSLSFGNEPAKTKFIFFRGLGGGEGKPLFHADVKNNFLPIHSTYTGEISLL